MRRSQNPTNYFFAARLAFKEYLFYDMVRNETVSPIFDDCPILCAKDDNRVNNGFCDNCESKIEFDKFEQNLRSTLKIRNVDPGRYTFAFLIDLIYFTLELEKQDGSKISRRSKRLVDLLKSERVKLDRRNNWTQKA